RSPAGGKVTQPRLLLDAGSPDDGEQVISRSTSAQVRTMLQGVLGPDGTGTEATAPGYGIRGNTGHAEKPENGVYSKTRFVASFIGFAPAANPKLLVAVIVD